MLPRIEARDSLIWAERLGVGTGAMEKSHRGAAIKRWQRQAGTDAVTAAKTPRGLMAALAAAGVPVKVVQRPARAPRRRKPS